MFARESDMVSSVLRWLKTAGLAVKREFVTPWGICDLVGLSFDHKQVEHRLGLKQHRTISSITRAEVLLRVPDIDTARSTTLDRLVKELGDVLPEGTIISEVERLIHDRFVITSARGRLQKVNGWMPLQDRLVAVELKLHRIEEALHQAHRNLGFAQESFVAFPMPVARRIASSQDRWSRFFGDGVGLIGVGARGCDTLIAAKAKHNWNDLAVQLYCVEKFWRTRSRS
jgi:hypothetical protein